MVVKRDGRREEFSKDKLRGGIEKAGQKRPVTSDAMEEIVEKIAYNLSVDFDREVPVAAIGERVMAGLRERDGVAYVRYASIYRRFEEATEFVQEVKKLETKHDTLTARLPGI